MSRQLVIVIVVVAVLAVAITIFTKRAKNVGKDEEHYASNDNPLLLGLDHNAEADRGAAEITEQRARIEENNKNMQEKAAQAGADISAVDRTSAISRADDTGRGLVI